MDLENTKREFLQDVMTGAIEGGIGYWAAVDRLQRDADRNVVTFRCRDNEDPDADWCEIDAEKIEAAINQILSTPVAIALEYRQQIARAYQDLDAGNIDAGLSDSIIQVAVYGDVIIS
jgi:hypothetical protein